MSATLEELLERNAVKGLEEIKTRVLNLESNDYYRPIVGEGVTSDPPSQAEITAILGSPSSFNSNVVGLIRDTTNFREWIVFSDEVSWYYISNSGGGVDCCDELDVHLADFGNPHAVTKTQVGLSNVPNLDTTSAVANEHTHANKAQLDLVTDGDHDVRTDNPHNVTAVQVGADPLGSAAAVASDLADHEADLANPHSVTIDQLITGAGDEHDVAVLDAAGELEFVDMIRVNRVTLPNNKYLLFLNAAGDGDMYLLVDPSDNLQIANLEASGDIALTVTMASGNQRNMTLKEYLATNNLQLSFGYDTVFTTDNGDIAFMPADNVGIGTTSPLAPLHLVLSSGEGDPTDWAALGVTLGVQNNASSGGAGALAILAGTAGNASLYFGDKDDTDVGRIIYLNSTNEMWFRAGGGSSMIKIGSNKVGFYNQTPVTRPVIGGNRQNNAALADALSKLSTQGILFDSTTAGELTASSYTDGTRPAAGTASRIIFNTDDGMLNIDDGTNWTLPDGTIT